MFTGIIEAVGGVRALRRGGGGAGGAASARLVVAARWPAGPLPGVALGDSVAVNGVCLTVVALPVVGDAVELAFDVSHETLARSGLGALGAGVRVNLERALRLGDRLGGHLVSGHVDGVGELVQLQARGEAIDLRYRLPAALLPEVVAKGSIAIDGVSLTVNELYDDGLRVTIIPHTATATQLLEGGAGKRVNVETDLLAKHVRRLVELGLGGTPAGPRASGVDLGLLQRAGFAETAGSEGPAGAR